MSIIKSVVMENKYDIYICYSKKDLEYARIITRIIESGGYSCFVDYHGIYSGDDFAARINTAIERCSLFVFLLSENTNQSRWSLSELSTAIGLGKIVLPIQMDDSIAEGRIDFMLVKYQHLKYVNLPGFETKLLDTIASIMGKNGHEAVTIEQRQKNIEAAEERRNGAKDYIPQIIDVDIFISYRRVDGRDYARNIMQALKIVGYPKVFFDYNSLRDGIFNTQILDAIYSCKDFILVISPLALKNCSREGDWVAKEIRTAIIYHKKIIPIVIEDTFQGWPNDFPKDLSSIKGIHFHKLLTDEYFEDSIDKLTKRLSTIVSNKQEDEVQFRDLQIDNSIHKKTVLYKIKVDRRCRLLIDDEEIQVLEAFQLVKLPLPPGEYMRKVVAIDDETVFEEVAIVLEHDKADIVSLHKRKNFWKRLFG